MRKLLFPVLLVSSLFGCQSDPCKNVSCINDGICFEGKCLCPEGYEGVNCETLQQATYDGNYTVSETCNLGDYNYSIQIVTDSLDIHSIAIYNLVDLGIPVNATVNGNEIDIFKQVLVDDTISGSGLFTESLFIIEYELIPDSGATLTCTASGMLF